MRDRYHSDNRRVDQLEKGRKGSGEPSRRMQQMQRIARRKKLRRLRALIMVLAALLAAALVIVIISVMVKAVGGWSARWKAARESAAVEASIAAESAARESLLAEEEEARILAEAEDVDLIMVGDILLHDATEAIMKQEDDTYDYSCLFNDVKGLVGQADLALVNQEIMIGGAELGVSGYPAFNAPYDLADDLAETGFNVILHASNHAYDMGTRGIENCLNYWKANYPEIAVLGIHEDAADAEAIYVYEQNGIKIAILNYTLVMNKSVPADESDYLIDRLKEDRVRADIRKAHTLADFIVVCPHWGTEYETAIDQEEKNWTQIFLEEEVDLVIGTHPHVCQSVELITSEDKDHQMLVYYSLGNFCTMLTDSSGYGKQRIVGGMARVSIARGENGKAVVQDYSIVPLICHFIGAKDSINVIPYQDYNEDLASEHFLNGQGVEISRDSLAEYCDQLWGELWR